MNLHHFMVVFIFKLVYEQELEASPIFPRKWPPLGRRTTTPSYDSVYLMEHIERATNTDQDVENLKILCDYLGKAHHMTFKFCCKLNLNFANPTTPWKSSLREKCI